MDLPGLLFVCDRLHLIECDLDLTCGDLGPSGRNNLHRHLANILLTLFAHTQNRQNNLLQA